MKTYGDVQNVPGWPLVGIMTAGGGTYPVQCFIHITMFIMRSRSMNTSRLVIF